MRYRKWFIGLLWVLATMNIIDMTLTGIGLQFGFFEEKNILMRNLWESHPLYFYIVKVSLSIALIFLAKSELKKRNPSFVTIGVTSIAVVLYSGVMVLHGVAYGFILFS